MDRTNTSKVRTRKGSVPILTSAFVLATLTAAFLLQGRSYRAGWLGFFRLDPTQFPISTADSYWLALHGWARIAVAWFNNAWELYLGYLPKLSLWVALCVFVILTWQWYRANPKRNSTSGQVSEEPAVQRPKWWAAGGKKDWLMRAAVALIASPTGLAVLPAVPIVSGRRLTK